MQDTNECRLVKPSTQRTRRGQRLLRGCRRTVSSGENTSAITPVESDVHELSLQDPVGQRAGGADTVEGTQECACAGGASPGSAKAPVQREVGVWEVGHRKMGARESPQHGRGMLGDRAVWGHGKGHPIPRGID